MSGTMTYQVVEPRTAAELQARLLRAGAEGSSAEFVAVLCDIPGVATERRSFTVKVQGVQFEAPMAFDLKDLDGAFIQIVTEGGEPIEFTLYA